MFVHNTSKTQKNNHITISQQDHIHTDIKHFNMSCTQKFNSNEECQMH